MSQRDLGLLLEAVALTTNPQTQITLVEKGLLQALQMCVQRLGGAEASADHVPILRKVVKIIDAIAANSPSAVTQRLRDTRTARGSLAQAIADLRAAKDPGLRALAGALVDKLPADAVNDPAERFLTTGREFAGASHAADFAPAGAAPGTPAGGRRAGRGRPVRRDGVRRGKRFLPRVEHGVASRGRAGDAPGGWRRGRPPGPGLQLNTYDAGGSPPADRARGRVHARVRHPGGRRARRLRAGPRRALQPPRRRRGRGARGRPRGWARGWARPNGANGAWGAMEHGAWSMGSGRSAAPAAPRQEPLPTHPPRLPTQWDSPLTQKFGDDVRALVAWSVVPFRRPSHPLFMAGANYDRLVAKLANAVVEKEQTKWREVNTPIPRGALEERLGRYCASQVKAMHAEHYDKA